MTRRLRHSQLWWTWSEIDEMMHEECKIEKCVPMDIFAMTQPRRAFWATQPISEACSSFGAPPLNAAPFRDN